MIIAIFHGLERLLEQAALTLLLRHRYFVIA